MKKLSLIIAIFMLVSIFTACTDNVNIDDTTKSETKIQVSTSAIATQESTSTTTTQESTSATVTQLPVTDVFSEPTTENLGSSLFHVDGVSVDDMIVYFNEIVLDTEFSSGSGDATLVQKWDQPIKYMVHGYYTDEDYSVICNFVDYLNGIDGFPGMYEVYDEYESNLDMYFCTSDELVEKMGGSDDYLGLDGAVTYWYNDNRIYEGIICYRNDIEQIVRNSVIIEEIYNGLGPVQDTDLRTDSIVYSGFSYPQEITEVDDVILRMLFHPDIEFGMNADECAEVIRTLYY